MSERLLQIDGLSKHFSTGGGVFKPARSMTAVRDVSLSLTRGEVVGVVGESGCGKSTLARLILRLIEPSAGSVLLDGVNVTSLPARELRSIRRRMGMVFQDPYSSLDPRYTIAELLAEPFVVQGRPMPKAAVREMLEAVGLPSAMAGQYAHQLSGGQRQRIGIARALMLKPELLLLDEPTASLDVSIQAQIIELLSGLRGSFGLTYLFISHDLGLVRYFCDRVVVMYLGAVVEVMPSGKSMPRHPYTRALLDSSFTPDPAARRSIVPLSGEIPSPFNLPAGCAFAGRCPRASEICRTERPPLLQDGASAIACFSPL